MKKELIPHFKDNNTILCLEFDYAQYLALRKSTVNAMLVDAVLHAFALVIRIQLSLP